MEHGARLSTSSVMAIPFIFMSVLIVLTSLLTSFRSKSLTVLPECSNALP